MLGGAGGRAPTLCQEREGGLLCREGRGKALVPEEGRYFSRREDALLCQEVEGERQPFSS